MFRFDLAPATVLGEFQLVGSISFIFFGEVILGPALSAVEGE